MHKIFTQFKYDIFEISEMLYSLSQIQRYFDIFLTYAAIVIYCGIIDYMCMVSIASSKSPDIWCFSSTIDFIPHLPVSGRLYLLVCTLNARTHPRIKPIRQDGVTFSTRHVMSHRLDLSERIKSISCQLLLLHQVSRPLDFIRRQFPQGACTDKNDKMPNWNG